MYGAKGFSLQFNRTAEALGRYDNTEQKAQDLCAFLHLREGASILELACGGGRFAGAFHRLGYHVIAVDLAQEQIDYARAHNPGPDYRVGDMRQPPDGTFDLIFIAYSSFGLLDSETEDRAALETWLTRLVPGGYFVLEVSDLERVRHKLGAANGPVVFEQDSCRESYDMDWDSNLLKVTYELDGVNPVTCVRQVYSSGQMAGMLSDAGFVNVEVLGSFQGGEKKPEDRAVMLGQRPPANA